MSFTFQQQATPASITTTTSGTATFANAPQSGEMVVAVLAINSSTATITPPTGFVAKNEYKNTSRTLGIYWKKAGAGESTGFTFNFSASVSGTIIMRRYSSSVGWDTDQSGGATDKVWDSTGTVSQVSLNLTTTLNRLVVGIGYASNTSAGNKQLNPNSNWLDNTLQYSSRARSAYRAALGGSETFGYQLTDSTLDNRLAFMVAEFVEYALKNAVASNKTLAKSWNNRRYSDPSKVPAIDTTPDAFMFTDQTDVALSTVITSAAITVSGINSAATITSSGGTFDINSSGTFISSGTVNNGDTVRARVTSSASNSTAVNCVVTIGGVSDTFTATTLATVVNIPSSFAASASGTTINLSWTDTNSSTAQTVIERSTDAGATWSALTTVAAGTNSYANSGLSAGSYYYRARALIGSTYSSYTSTVSATTGTTAWQLASGYYEPSKAEPIIVYPRSDANSHSSERHRLAPAGRRWRIPVSMYSGAWPFLYSVDATSAAKGITIGAQLTLASGILSPADDYAELSWDNPTIGSHTITVTVTTQENGRNTSGFSDQKSVTFTLVVAAADDTSKFIFLSGTGNDSTGTGTPSAPFRNLSKVFNSTAYAGRQCFLMSGTYTTSGSNNMALNYTSPAVLVADYGASPVVSLTQYPFILSATGCYVDGLEIVDGGYGATVADCRAFTVNDGVSNWVFNRVTGTNLSNGTTGGDNSTLIFSWGGGAARNNCVISRCSESGRTYTSNSSSLCVLFACDQGVAEFNTLTGNARNNLFLKDSNRKWSIRANVANCGASSELAFSTGCQLQSYATQDIEVSYNKSNVEARFNGQAVNTSGVHYYFRNSFDHGISGWQTNISTNGPFYIDKNAIEGSVVSDTRVITTNTECHNNAALDASRNLQGTYRTNYLGRRGAEVTSGA